MPEPQEKEREPDWIDTVSATAWTVVVLELLLIFWAAVVRLAEVVLAT